MADTTNRDEACDLEGDTKPAAARLHYFAALTEVANSSRAQMGDQPQTKSDIS